MYKKIIVCDISGTLINSKGQINPDIVNSIEILKGNNIGFILCSGGARVRTVELAKNIQASQYIISSNGSDVYYVPNNIEIYSNKINPDTLKNIINIGLKYNFRIAVNSQNYIYTNILIYKSDYEKLISKVGLNDLVINNAVQCIVSGKKIVEFKEFLKEISCLSDITIAIKNVNENNIDINNIKMCYADIVKYNTSKGVGLRKLCEYLKIEKQDVIAIGDSVNDLSLFSEAGYCVAMGNAIDELKERSNYVTLSNDEDGVNCFLKKMIKRM